MSDGTRRNGGGSAGGGGYELQSQFIAFVATHLLAEQPLGWMDSQDVPVAVAAETSGPGDDVRIVLKDNQYQIEVQVKRGLSADKRFYETLDQFSLGLTHDATLRVVLAVDSRASKPIKEELRPDLQRLREGRGDGLHPITERLLAYLRTHGTSEPIALAQRIYVVVIGMEDDAPFSRRDAFDLLSSVVDDPNQVAVAWDVLVRDGLKLIKERGQRDGASITKLFALKHISVSTLPETTQGLAYTTWLRDSTATFRIPGLGVALPIQDAWIRLQAISTSKSQASALKAQSLEAKLALYHEWERLSNRNDTLAVLDIAELDHRVVIIGGPGAGKSTLCQRVAHRLALSGQYVMWVRLPLVLRRMHAYGETIDEALARQALSGFEDSAGNVHRIKRLPDCLLADGLDECDPYRDSIADGLRRWAFARPQSRVVITTRLIGYDPAFFAGWTHAELLPFASDQIEDHAKKIFSVCATDQMGAEKMSSQFEQELRRNHIASVAARSPLLLGFLVQLLLNKVALPQRRAALYNQVLELWCRAPTHNRIDQQSRPDRVIARRALEIIGWCLHTATTKRGSRSREALISQLADHLTNELGISHLSAKSKADECLAYWEELGVLERLHVGHEDAYTFIHLSLGEYATGCYIAGLDAPAVRDLVIRFRRDPRWREVLLLAAGAGGEIVIIEQLLQLDDKADPIATEALLAAAALTEVAQVSEQFTQRVVEHVAVRVASPIPLIAYECIDSALGLAMQAKDLMANILQPLVRHPQEWTRITALRLALATDDDFLDLDALEACLDQGPPQSFESVIGGGLMIRRTRVIWNEVVTYGVYVLAQKRPTPATVERLKQLVDSEHLNTPATTAVHRALEQMGHPEIAHAHMRKVLKPFRQLLWLTDSFQAICDADSKLLASLRRITAVDQPISKYQRKLGYLSTLIHGLGLPELPERAWLALNNPQMSQAMDIVLSGVIVALNLDRSELAKDVDWAIQQLEKLRQDEQSWITLYSSLPAVVAEPSWERTRGMGLSTDVLAQALLHPSLAIAIAAANLIEARAGDVQADEFVRDILKSGHDQALHVVAELAPNLWGEATCDIVLERLEGNFTLGCRWLFAKLPELCRDIRDTRIVSTLMRGVETDDYRIATEAANALKIVETADLHVLVPKLRKLLNYWTKRGARCMRCRINVHGGSCHRCHVVPGSPRAGLVETLSRVGALNMHELIRLCTDKRNDVVKAASGGVAQLLTRDPTQLSTVVTELMAGRYPPIVAMALLKLPDAFLTQAKNEVLSLVKDAPIPIRRYMVSALANVQWIARAEALQLAREALYDQASSIRDQAAITLRSLERGTQK